ncbi:hypothetical protein BGZ83_009785 [Gryganskiella cystojenkinii]|nr:hypothetical protein BGZ83_009785 [Gryganskiella cystojenkinii]
MLEKPIFKRSDNFETFYDRFKAYTGSWDEPKMKKEVETFFEKELKEAIVQTEKETSSWSLLVEKLRKLFPTEVKKTPEDYQAAIDKVIKRNLSFTIPMVDIQLIKGNLTKLGVDSPKYVDHRDCLNHDKALLLKDLKSIQINGEELGLSEAGLAKDAIDG